ncbi:UNVERIFIED_CONTAM: RNA binding protein, heterogenous nuclear RNP-K like protein [Siphonaria sp. JEL0065]|nr:RNA binding protein, heterogenous nuclear RNP-K like protein [Siphonaria sp. JEL0065]
MASDEIARLTGLSLNPETPPPQNNGPASEQPASPTASASASASAAAASAATTSNAVTLRALISTKEAGIVIGSGGKNVADLREKTGVKAGVSKVVQGVHERVLTISGYVVQVAKAFAHIANLLIEAPQTNNTQFPDCATLRILVTHHLIGSVIGKAGAKIKQIQEDSGAKLVISKDMLPQSTERVVDVLGLVKSIEVAIYNIAQCVYNEGKPVAGAIPYTPQARSTQNGNFQRTGRFDDNSNGNNTRGPRGQSGDRNNNNRPNTSSDEPQQTQTLSIPSDMVGCIIGKGGSFIANIRRQSNAKLRISELEEGANANERVVTIVGSAGAIAKALQLIYEQLEAEKTRRLDLQQKE